MYHNIEGSQSHSALLIIEANMKIQEKNLQVKAMLLSLKNPPIIPLIPTRALTAPRVTMPVKVVIRAEKRVTVLSVCCQLKQQGKLKDGAEVVEEGIAEGVEYREEGVADKEEGVEEGLVDLVVEDLKQ